MFEKIFGIFRKGKKADFSAELPGETDEEMFDLGDTGMDTDFEADTISLETGMSEGDFSDPSAGGMASDPEFADTFGDSEPPMDEGLDLGVGLEEGPSDIGALEEPITPTPPPMVEEPEEEAYAAPKAKRSKKGLLVTIVVAIVGLLAGFLVSAPSSIEMINRATSSEPTLQEQLETLTAGNAKLDTQLKAYRSAGTVEEVLEIRAELQKRQEMATQMTTVEDKIDDRTALEDRLDRVTARVDQVKRSLTIQEGTLANVQKSLKQIEARNNYLISTTRKNLEQIKTASVKSDALKGRLSETRIDRAESSAMMSRDVQEGVQQSALEALSSM